MRDAGALGSDPTLTMGPLAHLDVVETIGRFVVLHRLGEGGMGVVSAAYDPELDRKVAIKVLRPHPGELTLTAEQRTRALREAQAMARLSHPNVITVHDVGTVGGTVFIAMELIDGSTLRARIVALTGRGAAERWRDALALMTPAGRGLAAAHAAGLVHRDFKPDNVLCGRDGRILVTDFGLVARAAEPREEGFVLGTPRYMAPEQHRGEVADARADQFAFCVALWEAVHRRHPFGDDDAAIRAAVLTGRLRTPRPGAPAWLHAALVRGLALDPGARWPSMDRLLAELTRDRSRRARRAAGAALVVAVAAGAVIAGTGVRAPAAAPCGGAERKLAGIWDAGVARTVAAALRDSGAPFAGETWRAVERDLDGYARALTAMHVETCRATHVEREQSEVVLDARMSCLAQRRSALAATTALLARADAGIAARAGDLTSSLPAIAECAAGALLDAPDRLPADAAQRARIAAARARLDEARALALAGRPRDGHAAAVAAVADARATGFAPVLAEALARRAALEDELGEPAAAAATLREAIAAAAAARHDRISADAWSHLIRLESESLGHPDEAERWLAVAQGAVDRLGDDAVRRATLRATRGLVDYRLGRYPAARDHIAASLDALIAALGPDHLLVAHAHLKLGVALRALGDREGALSHGRRALAIRLQLGAQHPQVADVRNNLGNTLRDLGRYAEALAEQEQALAARRAVYGEHHESVAASHNNRGMALFDLGRIDEAIDAYQRALAIQRAELGDAHPQVAASQNNLGLALATVGRHGDAVPYLRAALAARRAALPAGHGDIAMSRGNLGRALVGAGEVEAGLAELRAAASSYEAALGGAHATVSYWYGELGSALARVGRAAEAEAACRRAHDVAIAADGDGGLDAAYARVCLGRALVAGGRGAAAVAPLERALAVLTASEEDDYDLADARFLLARALGAGDRRRAGELARAARDGFAASQGAAGEVAAVEAWLVRLR